MDNAWECYIQGQIRNVPQSKRGAGGFGSSIKEGGRSRAWALWLCSRRLKRKGITKHVEKGDSGRWWKGLSGKNRKKGEGGRGGGGNDKGGWVGEGVAGGKSQQEGGILRNLYEGENYRPYNYLARSRGERVKNRT